MLTASPITNQPVGKTFSIAIGTLGAGAALQVILIGWALVHRPPVVVVAATPATVANTVAHVTALGPGPAVPATTFADLSNPFAEPPQTQTTAATPSLPPKPTPIARETAPTEPANRFEELVLQAKQLRERGDTNAAITKLREAGTLEAKNPIPLYELAVTYEKMGLADKAAEHWRKVYEMGPTVGDIYYSVAEAKLKAAQAMGLQQVSTQPTAEAVSVTEPHNNIAAGDMLGLGQITTEEQKDDNTAKHFVLHIPIEARPKARIDVRDLVIHVLFYDILDGQNVVVTSADVQSHWATPPADWVDSDTEELAVEYKLPKPEARGAKRENRKYFGYIVRIYYKQQLQAAAAEPVRLAQQYPPPPTLPKENEK